MNDAVQELFKVVFIFSVSFAIWTILNISYNKRPLNNVHKTIIIYIFLLLFAPINAYCQLVMDQPFKWLQNAAYNMTWFYGPLIYYIIRQVFLYPITFKSIIIHASLPLMMFSDRIFEIGLTQNFNLFLNILIFQVACYCVFSILLMIKNKKRLTQLFQGHQNSTYFWLMFLVLGLLVLNVMDILLIKQFLVGNISNMTIMAGIACMVSIYVSLISLLSIYQPQFFERKHHKNDAHVTEPEEKIRLRNIELSPEAVSELSVKLNGLVENFQPHLDPEISLDKLSSLMGVTRVQLSEFFNVHKETSFYDFLNELRFNESLKLLNQNNGSNSIADIAYQAGFNNRNTFYKVFKQNVGQTPAEYRKSLGRA
ncbi:helix-turn-helix domain-containing protein [Marinicellulosiphila megalodicopiae]|uniref:helix-turn-helix domain-containing protein n=1 Tax=Marinicellulosiphila megalodicopiae TaxID=2724896 RepID=UPI003BAFF634